MTLCQTLIIMICALIVLFLSAQLTRCDPLFSAPWSVQAKRAQLESNGMPYTPEVNKHVKFVKVSGDDKYTLVLYFHGTGRTNDTNEKYWSHIRDHCEKRKFNIIFVPMLGTEGQGNLRTWNIQNVDLNHHTYNTHTGRNTEEIDGCVHESNKNNCGYTGNRDEIQFVEDAINYYDHNYDIKDVIAGGFSTGSMLCLNLLNVKERLGIKKIFTIASNLPFGMRTPDADPDVRILNIHGVQDNTVPGITSGVYNDDAINKCSVMACCKEQTPSCLPSLGITGNKAKCLNAIPASLRTSMDAVLLNEFKIKTSSSSSLAEHFSCDGGMWLYYNITDIFKKISGANAPEAVVCNGEVKDLDSLSALAERIPMAFREVNESTKTFRPHYNIRNIFTFSADHNPPSIVSLEWGDEKCESGWHAIPGFTAHDLTDNSFLPFVIGLDFCMSE